MSGYSTHSVLYGMPLKLREYLADIRQVVMMTEGLISSHLVFQVFGDQAMPGIVEGIS